MNYVTINVDGNPNADELKRRAKQESMNGEYITWICRNCGSFGCDPKGKTENARILKKCGYCFQKEILK